MYPHEDLNRDAPLKSLLREWSAPETPPSLESRVMRARTRVSNWRLLFTGYIRVPVFVMYLLAALLTVTVWRAHVPSAPCASIRPVHCDHPIPGVC